jgi:hypothetical protein
VTDAIIVAWKKAVAWVQKCIAEPGVHLGDPRTLSSAQRVFDDRRGHQCYWNDRFCAAVICGMDERFQRLAAWCTVSNGLNGYWEPRTHFGFDGVAVLKYLGIVEAENYHEVNSMYANLPLSVCRALVEKFRLPTTRFGKESLSLDEAKEHDEFSATYPFRAVL